MSISDSMSICISAQLLESYSYSVCFNASSPAGGGFEILSMIPILR